MSLGVAILCGILYWLAEANLPFVGLWTLQRPLVCGFLTGCLLGQPVRGAVIGATITPGIPRIYFRWWINASRYGFGWYSWCCIRNHWWSGC